MRTRGRWLLAAPALLFLVACRGDGASGGLTLEEALAADWAELDVEIVTRLPEDLPGGAAIVFLHGYGSSAKDYSELAGFLLDEDTRIFLPTAVLSHPSGRGAIWWEFLEEDWPKPLEDWPRPSAVDPAADARPQPSQQLPGARQAIVALIAEVRRRYRPESVALVGHSQGAMLALDVAASVEPPLDRVALVAGYTLTDSISRIQRPRGAAPPTLVAHGRADRIVALHRAEATRALLEASGFEVTYRLHDGGHGIDETVTGELRAFLRPPGPR